MLGAWVPLLHSNHKSVGRLCGMKPNVVFTLVLSPELACVMWVLAAARNAVSGFPTTLGGRRVADSTGPDSSRNEQGCGQDHKAQPADEVAGRDSLPPVSRGSCP